jgi:hypothetical protein
LIALQGGWIVGDGIGDGGSSRSVREVTSVGAMSVQLQSPTPAFILVERCGKKNIAYQMEREERMGPDKGA